MKFGPVPTIEGEGAILAHALSLAGGGRVAKGRLLSKDDIARILAAGVDEIVVARPGQGDMGEDEAARLIGDALAGDAIRAAAAATGRVNLHAAANGLFVADSAVVDAINAVDPGVTLATLDTMQEVADGRMVATVKIIPYAVSAAAVARVVAICATSAIAIEPYSAKRIGVVATQLPSLKQSTMDKTIRVLEGRLALSGSAVCGEVRTGHETSAIADGIARMLPVSDIVLVFGASAIGDIDDVIPQAIRALGGRIEHFGMPVDPGNLLLLGEIAGKPVVGAPGCARSPAENGFDWVLHRLLAGRKVTAAEIAGLGVGGLLMEIGSRPQPREPRPAAPFKVSALVLAAGRSTRMGATNKLAARLGGKALIAHVAGAAAASKAVETVIVTGHQREIVEPLAAGEGVRFVHNPDYRDGLSTSLAVGIRALAVHCDAVIVLLGDMPAIDAAMIDRMIDAASGAPAGSIVVAAHGGKRGNPVLWPRRYFEELTRIEGDVGARQLIAAHGGSVVAVELGEAAAFDLDTPQALSDAGGEPA